MPNEEMQTETEAAEPSMKDGLSTWDDVRRLADEIELKIHLASMDARDRWRALEPRLVGIEDRMKDAGRRAGKAIADELESIWKALRGIRDDIANNTN